MRFRIFFYCTLVFFSFNALSTFASPGEECKELIEEFKVIITLPGDSAVKYLDSVQKVLKATNRSCYLEALFYRGQRYQYVEFDEMGMLSYYKNLLDTKQFDKNSRLLARTYITLAFLYEYILKEADKAYRYNSLAADIGKKIDNIDLISRATVGMKRILQQQKDTTSWKKLTTSLFKTLDQSQDTLNIDRARWIAYEELIAGSLEFGFLDDIDKYLLERRKLGFRLEHPIEVNYDFYLTKARLALKRGNPKLSIRYCDSVIEFPEWAMMAAKADLWRVKTEAYYELGKYDQCLRYLDSIKKVKPIPPVLQYYYEYQYKCYRKQGLDSKALIAHENFKLFTDSLKEIESLQEVESVKNQIKSLKQEERIKLSEQRQHIFKKQRWLFAGAAALVGLLVFLFFRQRSKKKIKELQAEMAEVQLASLKSQMNPHFMFNSINSIKGLIINEAAEAAAEQLTRFSKLMRSTLNYSSESSITIQEEIEFLNLYSDLERFKGKFPIKINFVVEPKIDPEEASVIPFLIQPFVENAFKHAFHEMDNRQPQIDIRFKKENKMLLIEIEDNGIGVKNEGASAHISKGTSLVEKRLELHNKKKENVSINFRGKDKGTLVVFRLK